MPFGVGKDERGHIRDISNIDPVDLGASRREDDSIVFQNVREIRILQILRDTKNPGRRFV